MNPQPQNRPLSPSQLFDRLLMGNFKQQQCEDQVKKVREQRQILIALIAEYRAQIQKRIADQIQLQGLLQLRAKLRVQLEGVRNERVSIDENISNQITKFKFTPIQIRQQSNWNCELEQIRAKNARMGIRIKQLLQYIAKMENYNGMLEKQNLVIREDVRSRSISENMEIGDWRSKIQALRKQHQNHSLQLRARIKQRQERTMRDIQQQQADIAIRNRQRMSSFQQRHSRKYFY